SRTGGLKADDVAGDQVAGAAEDGDAALAVPRDHVAGARAGYVGGAADGVAGRANNEHAGRDAAVGAVGNRTGTGDIGAHVVALDQVAGRASAADGHPVIDVAGNDVADGRRRAADGIIRRPVLDQHTTSTVGASDRAAQVDADVIALNHVAAIATQDDAV